MTKSKVAVIIASVETSLVNALMTITLNVLPSWSHSSYHGQSCSHLALWVTQTFYSNVFFFNFIIIICSFRKWQPTPVLLPRESCGQRSLVGCCPWGRTESDTTEVTWHTCMHWRRKWQPTLVFLPGESQGQRSLVGWRLWGRTESDTTEAT